MNAGRPSEEAIFNVARKIPDPEARADYLAQVCGEDAALRARVAALLAVREEQPDFLSTPHDTPGDSLPETLAHRPAPEGSGSLIGPYKLLEELNQGGFGVVYVADQDRPVRRRVALKVLKPGLDTRDIIARFEAEENALALMNHPNIAKVFDAGSTASGRPYFVMELVPGGLTLTDYCDKNNLPVEDRLRLFQDVCHAVHHAHQRGILHRDLKPGNVLVAVQDGRPVVKVIDFGIAKALHGQRLTDRTAYTRRGMLLGTPAYMSPEQADPATQDIDTRTDVWSLGVILYELLTGATPFDGKRLRDAGPDGLCRILKDEDPHRPSTRVTTLGAAAAEVSAHRGTELRRLSALLRGDLDLIVMKALEKDRTRRYDTAKDLADDILRHLNHQPVQASPPSTWYRARKFARRHRGAVAAASGAGLLFLAMAAAAWWGVRLRGERARVELRARAFEVLREAGRRHGAGKLEEAFDLVMPVRDLLAGDPGFDALLGDVSATWSATTTPPGATLRVRRYAAADAPWRVLGSTRLAVLNPRGLYHWQLSLPGHESVEGYGGPGDVHIHQTLHPLGTFPPNMAPVEVNAPGETAWPSSSTASRSPTSNSSSSSMPGDTVTRSSGCSWPPLWWTARSCPSANS